jgi:hypothetical protein
MIENEGLKREIGTWGLVANSVHIMGAVRRLPSRNLFRVLRRSFRVKAIRPADSGRRTQVKTESITP